MRLGTYIVLVVLAVIAVAVGQITIALLIGGAKAMLVGIEFMELRHAARPHLAAFAVFVLAVTSLLVVMSL